MAKSFLLKVTSAFVWGGVMRTRGSTITLAERDARHLLARGKVEIVTESADADGDTAPAPKSKAAAPKSKAAAKPKAAKAEGGDGAKNPDGGGEGGGDAPEA